MKKKWNKYYEKLAGSPPRLSLMKALNLFGDEGGKGHFAIDLGCGVGQDTMKLLEEGWTVLAIDSSPAAFDYFVPQLPTRYQDRLVYHCCSFEDARWEGASLVNASLSLPFCSPQHFDAVWNQIVRSLNRGGRFAGQFFGDRDDWKNLVLKNEKEIKKMLKGFEIEWWVEVEKDQPPATGGAPKHWHFFNVVARKL